MCGCFMLAACQRLRAVSHISCTYLEVCMVSVLPPMMVAFTLLGVCDSESLGLSRSSRRYYTRSNRQTTGSGSGYIKKQIRLPRPRGLIASVYPLVTNTASTTCPGIYASRKSMTLPVVSTIPTKWKRLTVPVQELELKYTLPTGQSFRWRRTGNNEYTGVVQGRVVVLRQYHDELQYMVLGRTSSAHPAQDDAVLLDYLNLSHDLSGMCNAWATADQRFAALHPYIAGARVLRQPPLECLLSFVCSSNNHISRIQGMVERLCSAYGTPIPLDSHAASSPQLSAAATPFSSPPLQVAQGSMTLQSSTDQVASLTSTHTVLQVSTPHVAGVDQKATCEGPEVEFAAPSQHEDIPHLHDGVAAPGQGCAPAVHADGSTGPKTGPMLGLPCVGILTPTEQEQQVTALPGVAGLNHGPGPTKQGAVVGDALGSTEPPAVDTPAARVPRQRRKRKHADEVTAASEAVGVVASQGGERKGAAQQQRQGDGRRLQAGSPEDSEQQQLAVTQAYYAFPTLQQLAHATEEELYAAGFGYRAKFITGTVRMLLALGQGGERCQEGDRSSIGADGRHRSGEEWLEGLRLVPYNEALTELQKLPGVGPKVAACVCLFSLDKHEAVPVDTHVWQIAQRYYAPHLKGRSLTPKLMVQVEESIQRVFGPYAGWAHNTLFIAELASVKAALASKAEQQLD